MILKLKVLILGRGPTKINLVEVVGIEPTSEESLVKRTTCVVLNSRLKTKSIKSCQLTGPVIFKWRCRRLTCLLKVETDFLLRLFLLEVASATLRLN